MPTRTGSFPIGFRRGWSLWQKADLRPLAGWAKENGFEAIDLGQITANDAVILQEMELRLGSVDLLNFGEIADPDGGKRKVILEANLEYIKQAGALGARVFFTIIPGAPEKTRAENYKAAVEAFEPIAEAVAAIEGKLAIEGYPGGAPHYALLCTTPETCRAFLKDLPKGVALNYDPSHLIRLGVDHVRFLQEFLPNVIHVHAKDTEIIPEAIYEFGLFQPGAFKAPHGFGQQTWRYTLPGQGEARWPRIFQILKDARYGGVVSIELEDEHFNGSEAGEKAGFLNSRAFLRGV